MTAVFPFSFHVMSIEFGRVRLGPIVWERNIEITVASCLVFWNNIPASVKLVARFNAFNLFSAPSAAFTSRRKMCVTRTQILNAHSMGENRESVGAIKYRPGTQRSFSKCFLSPNSPREARFTGTNEIVNWNSSIY